MRMTTLEQMREILTRDVIDDPEEILDWFGVNGVDMIDEILEARKHTLLLKFVQGLTLCENRGDISDNVDGLLSHIGESIEWNTLEELGEKLDKRGIGTLWD
jgi:hypothetical protein